MILKNMNWQTKWLLEKNSDTVSWKKDFNLKISDCLAFLNLDNGLLERVA